MRNLDPTKTGSNIARLRLERLLTQEELAAATGTSRVSVSKWERGIAAPRMTTLRRIAQALECDVRDFVVTVGEER